MTPRLNSDNDVIKGKTLLAMQSADSVVVSYVVI